MEKKIASALLSVYHKDGLLPLASYLHQQGVQLIASGGTASFLAENQLPVTEVADLTGYPSILGGRVKTLHPAVFGGILARRADTTHQADLAAHNLPAIDLVVVDLYPFEDTLRQTQEVAALIEKIDIGGISLIRAGAKNHEDVAIVSHKGQYAQVLVMLQRQSCHTTLAQRRALAAEAFQVSARYDTAICSWMQSISQAPAPGAEQRVQRTPLRYGENPHQAAYFEGELGQLFDKLAGKELSYNNILDLDGAFRLIADFPAGTTAIFKHANPCGIATRPTPLDAWQAALACDPTSAFGGIIISNHPVDAQVAEAVSEIFFEILCAPAFTPEAVELLTNKKNRILLQYKHLQLPASTSRTALTGMLVQDADTQTTPVVDYKRVTTRVPTPTELADLEYAERCVKHLKSNAICIVKNQQMIGAGVGQTSRIDALNQCLDKAQRMGFSLAGAVLASDGFFPFADSVQTAHQAGIKVFLQPGGSIRDTESIAYCNEQHLSMVFTGNRHFRH
jgi:phosphoribosylaminoimidazolecarboxamide formyltransferase/IMP cyclohydrolase